MLAVLVSFPPYLRCGLVIAAAFIVALLVILAVAAYIQRHAPLATEDDEKGFVYLKNDKKK
jgi:hypothetical protein